MQELEKILEEIDAHAIEFEIFGTSDDYISVGWAKDIIRKYMKNEEDILKFYYCESEDDYYLGQRVQNMYYAKYGPGGFTWFMSRYLPWGTDGYPSEPKEIPFMKWIEGFIRKHMNDGWIPVEERLPINHEGPVEVTVRVGYRTVGYYDQYREEWWTLDEDSMLDVIAWKEPSDPYRPERSGNEP